MNVAYIPIRGGSKAIPFKNIRPLNGKPLVYWVIKAACECNYIDKVYVATENKIIKETLEEMIGEQRDAFSSVLIIGRSEESASDTASTEFAMLEFASCYDFDNIVLIQATSPLLIGTDLNRGFEAFNEPGTDSVLSVVRQKKFLWIMNENGYVHSLNYDIFHRPRREEFDGNLVENGAFYITSRQLLLESGSRISGNIKAVEMHQDTFIEIDEQSDWTITEIMMKEKLGKSEKQKIPEIKMFLTDCDGCLTDGGMYYSENGDELKKFNTRDGMGFRLLQAKGIVTGIITSENIALNVRRAEKLKIDILKQGCQDKLDVIKALCEDKKIDMNSVAYIGDDINDLSVIKAVGFGCCPQDACAEIKKVADCVATNIGGKGVIREIAEIVLKARSGID